MLVLLRRRISYLLLNAPLRCYEASPEAAATSRPTPSPETYIAMQVFGLEAQQETVYAEVSPLVVSVLDGYNACIFAYGQVSLVMRVDVFSVRFMQPTK